MYRKQNNNLKNLKNIETTRNIEYIIHRQP